MAGRRGETQDLGRFNAVNPPMEFGELAAAFGMPQVDLDSATSTDFRLAAVLTDLSRQGIQPTATGAVVTPESPQVFVISLAGEGLRDARLLLFFEGSSGQVFFLQASQGPLGEPEVRLWGNDEDEILITSSGLQLARRTAGSLHAQIHLSVYENAIGANPSKTALDTLGCILRSMGIRLSFSSITSFFSSALCTQFSAISVGLTALNCLSIPAPAATFGCINGVAKIISCGIAACASGGSFSGSVSDATGDSGGTPVDLKKGSITVANGSAQLEVHFASSSFKNVAWLAQFDLDLDQNPATGHRGVDADGSWDRTLIGSEYIVNLEGSPPTALVYKNTGVQNAFTFVGQRSATLLVDGARVSIPLSMLGGDEGIMSFKVISTVQPSGIRDVMPNVGLAVGQVR
ncbi:MAG TPA: hypothetical protein VGX68_02915 [Thermoanaerobaculia bacterium]|nr:hypothetical protein [Thermoanaerobaculia bacterium]